jgi:hypothetical protein
MSARIVANFSHGLALSAIDCDADGGVWLSLWQTEEVVLVKLSTPSAQALWLALSKELGMLSGQGNGTPGHATGCAAGASGAEAAGDAAKCPGATASPARPPAPEPAPARGVQVEAP